MKTGLIYGYPNKPGKKQYSYHGMTRDCLIQPDPPPLDEYIHSDEATLILTITAYNIKNSTAICVGEIILLGGAGNCTWRGFEFWVEGAADYLFVSEFGDFPDGEFEMEIEL